MSQTKNRAECPLDESDFHLPGWTPKERHDFFEGIKVHGLKKHKKLQHLVVSKTQEDVRIATELYKRGVRAREANQYIERQLEVAGVTNEDYKTWMHMYMASQAHRGEYVPDAALEAFLEQARPRLHAAQELSFPGWRTAEINDFLATILLSKKITNVEAHIPSKTELEITGATDAYTIIYEARKRAVEHGLRFPTYDVLKPGYIYLQCIVAALNDDDKMKSFQVPVNSDPNLAKAQFVLKEWLMPDVGELANGWTRDEKYALIVAIQAYGFYNVLRIHSYFAWKTQADLKSAIAAIKTEAEYKESFYHKTTVHRYMSLLSWSNTLMSCTESEIKYRIAAGKRMMFALEELPELVSKQQFMSMFDPDNMLNDETTKALLNLCMQTMPEQRTRLAPMHGEQKGLERLTAAAAASASATVGVASAVASLASYDGGVDAAARASAIAALVSYAGSFDAAGGAATASRPERPPHAHRQHK